MNMGKIVQITITCDYCNKSIASTGKMPRFRLHLASEPLSHTSNMIFAVMVPPPITEDKYFCDLPHLLGWLETGAVVSPARRVDAAIEDPPR